jgi:hypothetical protein
MHFILLYSARCPISIFSFVLVVLDLQGLQFAHEHGIAANYVVCLRIWRSVLAPPDVVVFKKTTVVAMMVMAVVADDL